jgi:hypothetical protein
VANAKPFVTPRLLRDLHTYLAVFFAPTIVFFALTGGLQVFGLHESRDKAYAPIPIVEKLSQVHIHMLYQLKPPRPETAKPSAQSPESQKPIPKRSPSLTTKIFFGCAAAGLTLASLLGLWIGLTQGRLRKVSAMLAILGAAMPIGLVLMT